MLTEFSTELQPRLEKAMKNKIFLGIDTSNYTTSLGIVGESGELIANLKRPLPVKSGECGLRQSDAVFHHTVNIPELMREAVPYFADCEICCVGVSSRPRNAEGSYMPCFLVGVSVAESICASIGVPLYRFSHQCGHIMAALHSAGREELIAAPFGAFHISGGTTELVRVMFENGEFTTALFGATADLNAGQAIDRIGVKLGLDFPAGIALEKLALNYKGKIPKKKISIKSNKINLSGLENMAEKLFFETQDKSLVGAFVFDYIGRAISELASLYEEEYGKSPFVFAGGVMSNTIVRSILANGYDRSFAEPELSRDNAVGVAELARRKFLSINQ